MASDPHQNINFLPHDIEAKRRLVKQEIGPLVAYTEPEAGDKEAKPQSALAPSPSPLSPPPPVAPVPAPGPNPHQLEPGLNFLQGKKLPPLAAVPAASSRSAETNDSAKPEQPSDKKEKSKPGSAESKPGLLARLFARRFGGFARKPKPPVSASAGLASSGPAKATETKAALSSPSPEAPTRPPFPLATGRGLEAGKPALSAAAAPAEEILNVNLLSEEYAQAFVLKNQVTVFVWALAVVALAVVAGLAGVRIYESRELARLEQARSRNQALSEVMVSYRDLSAADGLLKRKVQALRVLLKKHISFRTFLEQLEAVTIPEVTYQNIAVTGKGGVNLSARAADYTAAARQLSIFQTKAPWIKAVVMTGARSLSGAETKAKGVGFDLALTVDESVFILKE